MLGINTARLHAIERKLGIVTERPEGLAGESNKPAPAQLKTEEKVPLLTQPSPVVLPTPETPAHGWSTAETPKSPDTHSWMNEAAAPPPAARREASAPFSLHVPAEKPVRMAAPTASVEVREPKRRDLESAIGGKWFNWIGIIAVIIGVAFFLKFAFDKQWIGPGPRIILSAIAGVSLLYIGERLRGRGLTAYAHVLSGGGILILYLADFAAYNFYNLIGQPLAFVLMAAVTTTAVLLAVRLNALAIAILGLIGGFSTPLLLSSGVDNEIGLFTYIALLDAGVLAVAYFKRWRSLDFLSFVGTVVITSGWALKFFAPYKVWTTLVFLSIFFLLYALLALFHNVLPVRQSRWFDVALAIANATFYFGLSYGLLSQAGFDHTTPATQALLVSIFFSQLFYMTWRWSPEDRLLRYSYVGASVTFLTMAVAIQLELQWVTMAWAVEALMLTWVGLRSGETAARHAALAVFAVALSHWFVWDMREFAFGVDPSFIPLLNARALSAAVLVGAIGGATWLYKRQVELPEDERTMVNAFLVLTGNAVALTLLTLDLNDYFAARLSKSVTAPAVRGPIENAEQFSVSVLWILYATTALALGVFRRSLLLRLGGLIVLVAAIGKVVVLDSAFYAASWHLPVLNQTFLIYALLVGALAFAAWLYGRAPGKDEPEQPLARPMIVVGANLLALTALTLEVLGYYDRLLSGGSLSGQSVEMLEEGRIFLLVLIWTIYGSAAFMTGAWRKARVWRSGGLSLLVITTPLVLWSLSYYAAAWHVLVLNRTFGAFAVFVTALWLVTRTYARSGEAFEDSAIVRPATTVVANLLAIVALSAQAAGYYEAKISLENHPGLDLRNLELAQQLSLSVIWGLYASGLLVVGRLRRLLLLRVMGLSLLSLTILKVFIWDVSSLDRIYRIISFIMLGAILLVVSYFYQRSQQRTEAGESSQQSADGS